MSHEIYFCSFYLFQVAYNSDEVLYIWKNMKNGVDYEEKLQLSQFEIKQTEFRGLNFSRGTTSENFQNNFHLLPNQQVLRSFKFSLSTFLYVSEGEFSVLQVVIALQRHTGYFLIQIYLPCTLLVVLSWVGFWLNREATSDRVGLGE